jgi:hypothetical protein
MYCSASRREQARIWATRLASRSPSVDAADCTWIPQYVQPMVTNTEIGQKKALRRGLLQKQR